MEGKKRCAIYTRKSVEEGLDMNYNTLEAQRDACLSYVASQKANGWVCVPEKYDDGGYSGGTLERPALKRLLADCEAGLVDIVVIYKIDRLTRSIGDFAELSKMFDKWNVSFVSVTQDINTSTSAGRMMLNILLTFAQYEREIIGERIRDKFAASRRKGIWMGGSVPFGYRVENRKLLPDDKEAPIVREIYSRFIEARSCRAVATWLNESAHTHPRSGLRWNTSHVNRILRNHTYCGNVLYKEKVYKGEHEPLVEMGTWELVQEILQANSPVERKHGRPRKRNAPLQGIIRCGHCGGAMSPAFTRKRGREYCYYVCETDTKRDVPCCPVRRLPAGDIEAAVAEQLGILFRTPTFATFVAKNLGTDTVEVISALNDIHDFWNDLFPAERERLVALLVRSVTVREDGLQILVKTGGMKGILRDLEDVEN